MYKIIEVTVSLCNGLSPQIMSVKNVKYMSEIVKDLHRNCATLCFIFFRRKFWSESRFHCHCMYQTLYWDTN